MGSAYLLTSEVTDYGLPATTTQAQINNASQLIDAFLKRPEGLVWMPDQTGNPCYMAAPTPFLTIKSAQSFSPGSNVTVQYVGANLNSNSIGEVLVLEASNPSNVEACAIVAVNPPVDDTPGTITLDTVINSHTSSITMDFGRLITEQREMPENRSVTRCSQLPLLNLRSGVGRYGYGRRSDQTAGDMQEFNLLAVIASFGGPPLWIPWAVANASVEYKSGEIWVPAGVLLAYFSDVKFWYVSGFPFASLDTNVKQACANIIANLGDKGLGANIRTRSLPGSTATTKFENDVIDANTRQMLWPFKARTFV
jgi:hypothetical protein